MLKFFFKFFFKEIFFQGNLLSTKIQKYFIFEHGIFNFK
jgi:hypothetical protein